MVGSVAHTFCFHTGSNIVDRKAGEPGSPAFPAWMSVATEAKPGDASKIRIKVTINDDAARDKNIRINSNAVSSNYGMSTVDAQLLVAGDGLRMSNIGDERVKSSVAVNSLASEVLSISGLRGEDLIFISNEARNPIAIGTVATTTEQAAREYSLVVNENDPSSIDIYDFPTGHIVGSRSIADDNSTSFQGLSIDFNGAVTDG